MHALQLLFATGAHRNYPRIWMPEKIELKKKYQNQLNSNMPLALNSETIGSAYVCTVQLAMLTTCTPSAAACRRPRIIPVRAHGIAIIVRYVWRGSIFAVCCSNGQRAVNAQKVGLGSSCLAYIDIYEKRHIVRVYSTLRVQLQSTRC